MGTLGHAAKKLNLKKNANSANIFTMIDIEKQIRYWVEGADSSLDTARILIKKKVKEYLQKTREMLSWLKKKLSH